jgi:hypothetical protein
MLVLCACSRGVRSPNQAQSPSPSAPTVASPQPTTTATPSPNVITPTPGTPGPSATTTPHASAPPIAKKVPRVAPDAAPEILGISMTETTVKPGDTVSGRVLTSSNVASVEARIGGYAMSLSKVGVGRFELIYKVAPLPWFVRGNFTMQVIARNTRGDTATRAIPLTVRQ